MGGSTSGGRHFHRGYRAPTTLLFKSTSRTFPKEIREVPHRPRTFAKPVDCERS